MSVVADNAPAPHALPVRHVVLFAFPGVQSLDVTGPLEVFAAARDTTVEVAAPAAGAFRTSSGLTLVAERFARRRRRRGRARPQRGRRTSDRHARHRRR